MINKIYSFLIKLSLTLNEFRGTLNSYDYRNIKTKYKRDHENRVTELLKIQKNKMVDHPLDLREMEMLEKSTRTMWIGKLSEFVQERQIEFDASLVF